MRDNDDRFMINICFHLLYPNHYIPVLCTRIVFVFYVAIKIWAALPLMNMISIFYGSAVLATQISLDMFEFFEPE